MEENKKKISILDKDDLAQSGMIAGGSTAAIGGVIGGMAAMHSRILNSKNVTAREKRDLLKHLNEKAAANGFVSAKGYLKHAKKVGKAGLLIGTPVFAVSAYKHHKYKNQPPEGDNNKPNN